MVRRTLEQRWKEGNAAAIYLNGHKDSVYCVQFDEYGSSCNLSSGTGSILTDAEIKLLLDPVTKPFGYGMLATPGHV
jgi:WD40 repeat protein